MKIKGLLFFMFILMATPIFAQDKEDLYNKALTYMDEEEYTVAINYLKQIIEIDSTDVEAQLDLAYCYMHTNNRFLAVDILEKLVNKYKKSGKLYTSEGEKIYLKLAEAYFLNYEFELSCQIYDDLINNGKTNKIRKLSKLKKSNVNELQPSLIIPKNYMLLI